MNHLLNKEDFILYESKYVSTNENIPPQEFLVGGFSILLKLFILFLQRFFKFRSWVWVEVLCMFECVR